MFLYTSHISLHVSSAFLLILEGISPFLVGINFPFDYFNQYINDRFSIEDLQQIMKVVLISILLVLALASNKPKPVNISSINQVYGQHWFSGYLDLDDNTTHMHYFFFPSQNNQNTDPVLFWFNGGPGCSSLLGALYEHGPFLINDAFASLINNQFAWNKKANVVYIESPANVGFSYMDKKAPTWNDDMVAKLNARAIREFFETWPEFQGRDTYLSGESYAGIYVPTAFYELHSSGAQNPLKFNLKGFAVGNGCTDPLECEFQNDYPVYLMQLYRDIGYITQAQYEAVDGKCANQGADLSVECTKLLDDIDALVDGFNIYDAYRPCYENNQIQGRKMTMKEMRRHALRKKKHGQKLMWAPPCVDSLGIDNILINKDNRKALGIPDSVQDYSMCNINDDFDYERSTAGSYWVYQKLLPLNRYKITIYSGDSDPAVPYAGTITWINKIRKELQLTTEEYWRPWYTTTLNGRQNSGSVWQLSNQLKLVVFKGIGHMAPQWNIEGGYKMINNLLHDSEI